MAKKPAKKRTKTAAAKKVRAVRVARKVVEGASTKAIAADLGVSESQALRILDSVEVQQVLVQLVNGHVALISSLIERSLGVIGDALAADRPAVVTKKGEVVEGGPDHFARLTAVARLIKLLTAGRPTPRPADQVVKGTTLADLEAEIELTTGGVAPSSPVH